MRITQICANTANDDANKNKLKTQNSKLSARGGSSFGGKAQNYNLKVKSNVITIHEVSGQSNPYLSTASLREAKRRSNLLFNLVIASPALLLKQTLI